MPSKTQADSSFSEGEKLHPDYRASLPKSTQLDHIARAHAHLTCTGPPARPSLVLYPLPREGGRVTAPAAPHGTAHFPALVTRKAQNCSRAREDYRQLLTLRILLPQFLKQIFFQKGYVYITEKLNIHIHFISPGGNYTI